MANPNSSTTTSNAESDSARPERHREATSSIVDRVKERAAAELKTQRDRASAGIGTVVQAVRQSTQQLRDENHDQLAHYVNEAADRIDLLARQLRTMQINDVLTDARRLARRQPAIFVGSAFVVGLLGARFFKSSSGGSQQRPYADESSRRAHADVATTGNPNTSHMKAEPPKMPPSSGSEAANESASTITNRGRHTRQPSEKA
jgi:hypothetical protein